MTTSSGVSCLGTVPACTLSGLGMFTFCSTPLSGTLYGIVLVRGDPKLLQSENLEGKGVGGS